MAKQNAKELAKTDPKLDALAVVEDAPAYLVNPSGRGVGGETAAANAIQVRMKVVQPQTKKDTKDEFGEGSIILTPDNILLHELDGDPVTVIVVHQHESFECWGDINDRGAPTVQMRSVNPASELAARCQSQDDAAREEKYGDGRFTRTYDVYHNFVCLIDSGPQKGKLCRVAYGGKYNRSARKWSSVISDRMARSGVDIFAMRFDLVSEYVERDAQQWYVITARNVPSERGGSWVGQEMTAALRKMYDAAESAYRREIEGDKAREQAEQTRAEHSIPV